MALPGKPILEARNIFDACLKELRSRCRHPHTLAAPDATQLRAQNTGPALNAPPRRQQQQQQQQQQQEQELAGEHSTSAGLARKRKRGCASSVPPLVCSEIKIHCPGSNCGALSPWAFSRLFPRAFPRSAAAVKAPPDGPPRPAAARFYWAIEQRATPVGERVSVRVPVWRGSCGPRPPVVMRSNSVRWSARCGVSPVCAGRRYFLITDCHPAPPPPPPR
ncbi:uncharacterized protein LOC126230110 [Schistocerca nitens]|uniref:uncharacterized protein LOC126230110 n=1 Tax=Schistocerca nitens TaxID=7011 RepID=UPI002118D903|nr:uncharacterized protein LOC126230110 [Schistocerca nitens]